MKEPINSKAELSISDTEKEQIRLAAYNKGLSDGKRFAAYYILDAFKGAQFNKPLERTKMPKMTYVVRCKELIERLCKTFGVTI